MLPLILAWNEKRPHLGDGAFVAPTASIVGDVVLGARVSVWFSAVVRGDVHSIVIGDDSNVQDGAVIHGTLDEWPVVIGARTSIGHQATVHGATVGDDVLVGIGARILDGARIGNGSLIAAGALVREGTVVPENSLVVGVPGVVKRALTAREMEIVRRTPGRYRELAARTRAALHATFPDEGWLVGS
jgi:carbonic anhydrase/acetyltransferase-like protein (isoleucine patch superfamily)